MADNLNPNKKSQDPVSPPRPKPKGKKPADYGSRDAGDIMQTGKTNHGKRNAKDNPGYNKPEKIKGPGPSGANGGWKPLKDAPVNKSGSYGTGPAKNGY